MSASYLSKLFQKPLFLGASVSGNYASLSPGRKLALRYTKPNDILTIAQSGASARQMIPKISDELLRDRTVVVAVDLLFWDSTFSSAEESIALLQGFLERAKSFGIPVVLGDVPELAAGFQTSRKKINAVLKKWSSVEDGPLIFGLDALCEQLMRDGYLTFKEKKYSIFELVPDGLHLSDTAGDLLADQLAALLSSAPHATITPRSVAAQESL